MLNNQTSLQHKLNFAMQNMHQGRYQQALVVLLELESSGMRDYRLFLTIGSGYQRLKQDIKALEYFEKSLSINSKQGEIHFTVGKIYKNYGELSKAISHVEMASKLQPNNDSYYQELGFIHLKNKSFESALPIFSRLVGSNSANTLALLGIARAYAGLENDKQRSNYINLAEKVEPNHPMVLNDKARLLKELGEYQESKRYFIKYSKNNPNNDEAYENLALIELSLNNPNGALDITDKGIEKFPQSRLLHKLKSSLSFEMGHENYLTSYKKIDSNKMPINLHIDFILVLLRSDDVITAEIEFNLLSKKVGSNLELNTLWLTIQEKQLNYESILAFYKKLDLKLNKLSNSMLEILTRTYMALGLTKLSFDVASELVRREPHNQYYWALYSTSLRLIGDERYHDLCNFNEFVQSRPILLPKRFGSIEDFNLELKLALQELHVTKEQPLQQSLIKGTQTPGELLNKPIPIIRELNESLRQTSELILSGLPKNLPTPLRKGFSKGVEFSASWSVNLKKSGYHKSHVHSKGCFSSAYYVSVPIDLNNEKREGWLYLGKPDVNLPAELGVEKWIKPEPGHLVLFPSYMWHGTQPFQSLEARLTVAFDILPK